MSFVVVPERPAEPHRTADEASAWVAAYALTPSPSRGEVHVYSCTEGKYTEVACVACVGLNHA